MKSRKHLVRGISTLLVGAVTALGCANGGPPPLACAAIAGLLGAGGAGVAATHLDGPHDDEYVYPIGLAGGLVLGTAGYFICKAMQHEEVAETPPPAPAPRMREPEPAPPERERIVLRGVNFDFDKSNIRPDAAVILDEAVRILGGNPTSVSVEGHTDSIGSDAYNQSLSERRAGSVKRYLTEHGVESSRLSTVGFGESRPIASNQTREGRALNRRVELNVQE